MNPTAPKNKDGTHTLFVTLLIVLGLATLLIGMRLDDIAKSDARVEEYSAALSGRGHIEIEPEKGPLITLLAIAAVVVVGLIIAWIARLRAIDKANANIPNHDVLNQLFGTGQEAVAYQVTRGGMNYATLVAGASAYGYVVESQGHDGSLIFRATHSN